MPTDPGGGPDPADSAVAVRRRVRHDHAVFSFNGLADGRENLAFGLGDKAGAFGPGDRHVQVRLVRPHSECLTGDVFGSERCDCGPQMREAVERIAESGGSCCTYGRRVAASGLSAKLEAYALQDDGLDTYEANRALGHGKDERTYAPAAAQMMQTLGLKRVALLSNSPGKAAQPRRLGMTVTERVPTAVHLSVANAGNLATKASHGPKLWISRAPGCPRSGCPAGLERIRTRPGPEPSARTQQP